MFASNGAVSCPCASMATTFSRPLGPKSLPTSKVRVRLAAACVWVPRGVMKRTLPGVRPFQPTTAVNGTSRDTPSTNTAGRSFEE